MTKGKMQVAKALNRYKNCMKTGDWSSITVTEDRSSADYEIKEV